MDIHTYMYLCMSWCLVPVQYFSNVVPPSVCTFLPLSLSPFSLTSLSSLTPTTSLQSQKAKGQPLSDSPTHHRLPSDQTTLLGTSLQWVEAIALVALCSYRPVTRRVALMILKEVRLLREVLGNSVPTDDANVMDVIDKAAPVIIARHIETLMPSEKVRGQL